MAITDETLRAMIRDFQGFELSDSELELIRPEVENYMAARQKLDELDLSNVLSGRLMRLDEGSKTDA